MSKLSFRARALDASKPMPVYLSEDLPDLPDYSAINRAVPQMPSGMEKEEECEHHLQRAICTGLIIPTPEVLDLGDQEAFIRAYRADYKMPRQLIHMQPLAMEQDIPDYDMDSGDEVWVQEQSRRLDLTILQFEQMMDRLEKSSEQTVVTLSEAKALLKQDDELIIAVYDYWLNKRLKTQHPLILAVKTEHRGGAANNPYLAFRRRTEKMQTRKNRKNDETSYEKMLKLRRDLCRTLTLLELTKKREEIKKKLLQNEIELNEKRFQAKDFSGQLVNELSALKSTRPAFAPLFTNQFPTQANTWNSNQHFAQSSLSFKSHTKTEKDRDREEYVPRREKRQYKKRKHKNNREKTHSASGPPTEPVLSSEEEEPAAHPCSEPEEDGTFSFRRSKNSNYHMPVNAPEHYVSPEDRGHPFGMASLRYPKRICLGMSRRRVGRGGRYLLDRTVTTLDDIWATFDYTIQDNVIKNSDKININILSAQENSDSNSFKTNQILKTEKTALNTSSQVIAEITPKLKTERLPHFRPQTPPASPIYVSDETPIIDPNQVLSLEIQNLSKQLPPYVLPQSDPFFTSEFTFQDIIPIPHLTLEDALCDLGDTISFTMSSFNENDGGTKNSSITMGEGVLDTILSESQINDLKSLHGSTTSLSDILDDQLGGNLLNLSDDMESSDLMLDKPKMNHGDKEKNDLFQHSIDLVSLNHMTTAPAGFNSEYITLCAKDIKSLPTEMSNPLNNQNVNGRSQYIVNTLASISGSSKFIIINHEEDSIDTEIDETMKDESRPKVTSVSKTSKLRKMISTSVSHPKPQQSLLNKSLLQKSVTLKGKQENLISYADHYSIEANSNGPGHEVRILSSLSPDKHNLFRFARQKHTGAPLGTQSSGTTQFSVDASIGQSLKPMSNVHVHGLQDIKSNKKTTVIGNIQDTSKTSVQLKTMKSHNMVKQNIAPMNVISRTPNLAPNLKTMHPGPNLPKQFQTIIGQTVLSKTIQQMPKTMLPGMPGVPGVPGMPGMTGIPGKKSGHTALPTRTQSVNNSQLVKIIQGENTLNNNR